MTRLTLALSLLLACNPNGSGDDSTTVPSDDVDEDGYRAQVDCDDHDASVHPGAEEVCNGADDDCNGVVDDDATGATEAFVDSDGDGYGVGPMEARCEWDVTTADNGDDCDDDDPGVNPAATEVCDADNVDEDCSGAADDEDPGVDPAGRVLVYEDADGDGVGNADVSAELCDLADGWAEVAGDCDDTDASRTADCVAGTYSGPLELAVTLIDELMGDRNTTTCTGTATADVALAGDPQVLGEWTCTIPNQGDVSDSWDGAVDGTTASGTFVIPSVSVDWTGTFDGHRRLDVVVNGTDTVGPTLTIDVFGEMALERD